MADTRKALVGLAGDEQHINPCRRCGAEARKVEVSEKWTRIECTGCDAKTADYYWPHGGDPREEWNAPGPQMNDGGKDG